MGGYGKMASAGIQTDSGIINAIMGNKGASNSRDMLLSGGNRANESLNKFYQQMGGQYQPYQQAGGTAVNWLSNYASNPRNFQGWGGFAGTASRAQQATPYQMPGNEPVQTQAGNATLLERLRQGPSGMNPTQANPAAGGSNIGGLMPGGNPMESGMGMPSGSGGPGGRQPVMDNSLGTDGYGGPGGTQPGNPAVDSLYGGSAMPGGPTDGSGGPGGTQWGQGFNAPQALNPGSFSEWMQGTQSPGSASWNLNSNLGPINPNYDINDQGLQFVTQRGIDTANQQAASRGLYNSGAAIKGATDYAQSAANQYVNDAWNRALAGRNQNLQAQGQMFGQDLANRQFGLGAQGQAFNQGLQGAQFGWGQLTGNRDYDMQLRNQQQQLNLALAQMGLNATNQYGGIGAGITGNQANNILGMAQAQAAAEAAKSQNNITANTQAANAWSDFLGGGGMGGGMGSGGGFSK